MKKFFMFLICAFTAFLGVSAYAASELRFEPVGGGKFIYCNNPEGIDDSMLLNGKTPRYIMNNENLTPDTYYIYLSHYNYTGTAEIPFKRGYDIELDMKMTARETSKITIRKAFFETPQEYGYFKNQNRVIAETDIGQLGVCANMLGIPMCDIRGDDFYYPSEFEPITLELEKGDTVWLSEYLNNYEEVHFGKAVHIQALVEIESGRMDFNVGAVKSEGIVGDREGLPHDAEFGEYRWDYSLKGTADTLPEVKADIEYTIDNTTEDGAKIPVFLKNQYIPEGHEVTEWYTQLNPQNDIWTKTTAAESDILPLEYRDDTKLKAYGSAVPASERNNIWRFDTLRSGMKYYDSKFFKEPKDKFVPNFVLDTDTDNHAYACNIGNYGVATTYSMKVTNDTDTAKYCSLVLTTADELITYETDKNGSRTYAYIKDKAAEKVRDTMLSHKIPPRSTEEFEFSLILPVNYCGGIKNELVITDKNMQAVDFEQRKTAVEAENDKSGYRRTNEIYGRYISDIFGSMPPETAEIFRGGERAFEQLRGKDGSIIRWCAWDGFPNSYYNLWGYANTVYALDSDLNITGSFTFPSLPYAGSWRDGSYYIKTARDGVYKSDDGIKWEKTNEPLPEYIPYYDLENASEWAIPELEEGWDEGIRLTWYGHSYNFTSYISREGFCETAAKLLDRLKLGGEIEGAAMFDDTSNPQVERLAAIGVINGFGDGTFRPDDWLTREQAAVILKRLTEYIASKDSGVTLPQEGGYADYADAGYIAGWAVDGVKFVRAAGVMQGVGDGMFEPQGGYSVEQSAATLLRLLKYCNCKTF